LNVWYKIAYNIYVAGTKYKLPKIGTRLTPQIGVIGERLTLELD